MDNRDINLIARAKAFNNLKYSIASNIPILLKKHPQLESFIKNTIDTNIGIQIPALQHTILSVFRNDGITQSDLSDNNFLDYINNILIGRGKPKDHTSSSIGKDVGTSLDSMLNDSNKDPFGGLAPYK